MDGLHMKYFVLNPNKYDRYGHASRKAMLAYSRSIRKDNPKLADDLQFWAWDIEAKIAQDNRKRDLR